MRNFILPGMVFVLLLASCKPAKKETEDITSSFNSCLEVVEEILLTSSHFIEYTKDLNERVIANGGIGYGYSLERSPDSSEETPVSDTYDFILFESYEDHSPLVARFSFNVEKEQLYEYDAVLESMIPISFNQELLPDLRIVCKKK